MKPLLAFVGYLEGFSFLILFFYAMPMKYFAGEPEMVSLFGAVHGGPSPPMSLFCSLVLAGIGQSQP